MGLIGKLAAIPIVEQCEYVPAQPGDLRKRISKRIIREAVGQCACSPRTRTSRA
jgi:hypothetical protein